MASLLDGDKHEGIAEVVASEEGQTFIKSATKLDNMYKALTNQMLKGWPATPATLSYVRREYFPFSDELTVKGNFIFKGLRLLVPASARQLLTERAHLSQIGLNGCKRPGSEAVFWLGMTKHIKDFVSKCLVCVKLQAETQPEPLLPHPPRTELQPQPITARSGRMIKKPMRYRDNKYSFVSQWTFIFS